MATSDVDQSSSRCRLPTARKSANNAPPTKPGNAQLSPVPTIIRRVGKPSPASVGHTTRKTAPRIVHAALHATAVAQMARTLRPRLLIAKPGRGEDACGNLTRGIQPRGGQTDCLRWLNMAGRLVGCNASLGWRCSRWGGPAPSPDRKARARGPAHRVARYRTTSLRSRATGARARGARALPGAGSGPAGRDQPIQRRHQSIQRGFRVATARWFTLAA